MKRDHWGPFNMGVESETVYEYGPCGLPSSRTRSLHGSRGSDGTEWVYDDDCALIGRERREKRGEGFRAVRLTSTNRGEALVRTSEYDYRGRCEEELHHVFSDADGGVTRHVVDRATGSIVRNEFVLDAHGLVQQMQRSYSGTDFQFVVTVERFLDRTSIVRWGVHGEVIDTEDRFPFAGGELVERFDMAQQRWSVMVLDEHMRGVRAMSGRGLEITDSMRFRNVYDRYGNLVEWHRATLPEGSSSPEFMGYRFDIEYSQDE